RHRCRPSGCHRWRNRGHDPAAMGGPLRLRAGTDWPGPSSAQEAVSASAPSRMLRGTSLAGLRWAEPRVVPGCPQRSQVARPAGSQSWFLAPEAAGASLPRNDRGQVTQRVAEVVWSERREVNALAGNRPYRRPVIGERDLGLVRGELGQVVTPDPAAEL